MAKVLGIGGFFFRAKDPAALAAWYEETFEINQVPQDYHAKSWQQQAGTTVFAPFDQQTEYFGRPEQSWMLNFRVEDLNQTVTELRQSGIIVEVDETLYPNGKFARLVDPEGNPIQLWQPMEE